MNRPAAREGGRGVRILEAPAESFGGLGGGKPLGRQSLEKKEGKVSTFGKLMQEKGLKGKVSSDGMFRLISRADQSQTGGALMGKNPKPSRKK